MKNNKSVENRSNISFFKKLYYITLENAGKRTEGGSGHRTEGIKPSYFRNTDP